MYHLYCFPYSNVTDMQQWIGAINKAAAIYSSAPLAAPMSSSVTFMRPTFPLAPTRNTLEQQVGLSLISGNGEVMFEVTS